MNRSPKIIAVAVVAASLPWLVASASAAPIASPQGLNNAASSVETVQYRRGWGWRRGGFVGPAIAGAIIGGAIIGATQPYAYGGYGPGYGYYGPGYAYGPGYGVAPSYAGGDAIAYCQQRFRSYDPASGTYLGYDGIRHSCP